MSKLDWISAFLIACFIALNLVAYRLARLLDVLERIEKKVAPHDQWDA